MKEITSVHKRKTFKRTTLQFVQKQILVLLNKENTALEHRKHSFDQVLVDFEQILTQKNFKTFVKKQILVILDKSQHY